MGRADQAVEAAERLEGMGASIWALAAIYMRLGRDDEAMTVLKTQVEDRTVFPFAMVGSCAWRPAVPRPARAGRASHRSSANDTSVTTLLNWFEELNVRVLTS